MVRYELKETLSWILVLGMGLLCVGTRAIAGSHTTAGGKQASTIIWFQNLSGTVGGQAGGASTKASIEPNGETRQGYAVTLKTLGSFALDLSYSPLSADSTFTSENGFGFGGENFGSVVNGDLRYRMPIYEGALRYIVLNNAWFRISTSMCLKLAQADVTLSTSTKSHRFNHTVPIPMAGLSAQLNVTDGIKLYGSFKFLEFDPGVVSADVDDWEGGIIADWSTGIIPSTLRMALGYRDLGVTLISNKAAANEARLALKHKGPFAELTASF